MKKCNRFLYFLTIVFAPFSWCKAQVLHSSTNPSHVANWGAGGLHSSVEPEKWVNEGAVYKAGEERKELSEPIIPYTDLSAKRKAESEMKNAEKDNQGQMVADGQVYQSGVGSYYSAKLHGRKMADGTICSRDGLFCAHRTLPFGTKLRVVNKKNGRDVIVEVHDRGPFGKGRVVDLSYRAASELGMLADGVVSVDLYVVK